MSEKRFLLLSRTMVELYYYDYPRPFHSTQPLQPADQSLNYWFSYPNQDYLEALRQDALKVEKGKGKDDKKEGKKDDKKDEKKDDKKDEKKDDKKDEKKDDKKPKLIELKVPLCCDACARKVRKKLENMKGVEKPVICDLFEMKVSVNATAKPEDVLSTVKKVKKDAEMWPQKKK